MVAVSHEIVDSKREFMSPISTDVISCEVIEVRLRLSTTIVMFPSEKTFSGKPRPVIL